jgi:micrococcal nuclease
MHLLILPALTTATETFTANVVKVKDGDSIVVNRDDGQIEIRLRDIDCPESEQPYGQQAKQQTSTLCLRKAVTVNATGQDRYGRTLAFVTLPNCKQLNRDLVGIGAAWWYRKYSTDLDPVLERTLSDEYLQGHGRLLFSP